MILEPQAVADVLPFLTESFDARTADEGRSAFSRPAGRTKVGEPLFDGRVNLFSDPAHYDLPAPAATDEGVPASRITGLTRDGVWLIESGRVQRPGANLRFNQSLLAMLAPGNVEMVGVPERLCPMMVPALKLQSFAFTSQSDAV